MIKSKKQMLAVIGVFILTIILGTTTYAFFNFTRTGSANTIRTGRIAFNSMQNGSLSITNVFPLTSTQASNANLDAVTVHIEGDTTYADGEEFRISIVGVNNTVNNKTIPINYIATYAPAESEQEPNPNEIGSSSDTYYTSRGSTNKVYKLNATGEVANNTEVLIGYIPNNATEINGTLTIKAYIDGSRLAISDTYPEQTIYTAKSSLTEADVSSCTTALTGVSGVADICDTSEHLQNALDDGNVLSAAQISALEGIGLVEEYTDGTTSTWVAGRTVLTTTEWNSFQNSGTPLSFKIKAESNEGVWVPLPPPANAQEIAALLTDENAAGNKIYTGSSPANYVTFNGESWRIIGVYGDKLKIVKAEPLEDTQKWQNSGDDGNTWNGSLLETYLNTTYYSNLSQTAQEMIAEGSWDVGACGFQIAASAAYTCAHGTTLTGADTNSNRVKVGLIATYEYLYAAENTCWATSGYDYGDGNTCNQQDWLYGALTYNGSSSAWALSPDSDNANGALHVLSVGCVSNSGSVTRAYAASPVVYLKSDVIITGGDGTTPQTAYTLSYTAS